MGVPQGSILGPFLLFIYINDLHYFMRDKFGVVSFADDTSLLFKIKRHELILDDVNNTRSELVHWFSVNNLLLNSEKTKCIKFVTPNVKKVNANIFINSDEVSLVDTTKFLGIILDCKLQWGPHISVLAKKLSAGGFAVDMIRQLTDIETARLVYFAYFYSLMNYGILLWGGAADINTIFVLQKRAIRSIYLQSPRCSLREIFKEANILTVASQFIFANLVYVHKNIENFLKVCDIHSLNTRNKNKLLNHKTRLQKISKSFKGYCIHF
ncbi:hypothetical protein O3G_MSEX000706 [Manduca sexta]|nr:hypothetical protein O3G_MSEX000706 [Manduca sexta]